VSDDRYRIHYLTQHTSQPHRKRPPKYEAIKGRMPTQSVYRHIDSAPQTLGVLFSTTLSPLEKR